MFFVVCLFASRILLLNCNTFLFLSAVVVVVVGFSIFAFRHAVVRSSWFAFDPF